jgi:hypothetical protein
MKITVSPATIKYEEHGWRVSVSENRGALNFAVESINTGGFEFESGTNFDQLAALIVAAKADALSRGINWSGN